MIRTPIAVALALTLSAAGQAAAQNIPTYVAAAVADKARPAADTQRDVDRKPAESVAFSTVKPGDIVIELIAGGGYFTRILSKTVGPKGHIYATIPENALKTNPNADAGLKALAADPAYSNVSVLVQPNTNPAGPVPADVVWTSLNYHDLHNSGRSSAGDLVAYNKAIFNALKPGGVYFIIDHAAAKGSGATATSTLHRIEADVVKDEVQKAGFVLDGESNALVRPEDDRTTHSSAKGEMFILRFRRPN